MDDTIDKGFWYIDYMAFENKENIDNRLVLGLRYMDNEKTDVQTLYLKENISIATDFFYHNNYEGIEDIIEKCISGFREECQLTLYTPKADKKYWEKWKKNKQITLNIVLRNGNYSVLEINLPYNKSLISKLPGKFQLGSYDKFKRFEKPYLYKKIELDKRLEEVFTLKNKLEDYVDKTIDLISSYSKKNVSRLFNEWSKFLASYKDEFEYENINKALETTKGLMIKKMFKNEELAKKLISIEKAHCAEFEKAKKILKEINPKNEIFMNYETKEYEITLDDISQIKFSDESITYDDLMKQVWVIGDIEKPLWKREDERSRMKLREYLLGLKRGEKSKLEHKIEALEKKLSETRSEKRIRKLEAKIDGMRRLVKDYSKEPERIDAIIAKLEDKLTVYIAGYKVKLWEEEYDAKISWFALIYKMHDGSLIKELHTIRDTGLEEINDFKIIHHKDEKSLVSRIIKDMRERKVAVYANHNLPYDVTQLRYASEELNAEPFDIFVKNVFPRRDVVRKIYQRMKKGTFEYYDTYRQAVIHHTYLRSNNPKGDHKLATFVNHIFGENTFTKSINYDELREYEVRAINGDKEAARIIADYTTSDVLPILRIVTEKDYLKTAFMLQKNMPYLTLSEILFSPQCVRKFFEFKHWKKNRNHKYYEYSQKQREDFLQIFKKRFPSIKREQLRKAGINISTIPGTYDSVIQAYVPFEEWLAPVVNNISKEMSDFMSNLSENPVKRFGQLQYVKAFLRDVMADYYFAMNEKIRFENLVRRIPNDNIIEVIDDYLENAPKELINKYYSSYDNLKNQYRSIYVAADAKSRSLIRGERLHKAPAQLSLLDIEFFDEHNMDIILLRKNAEKILDELSEGHARELRRFLSNYITFEKTEKELCEIASKIIDRYKISIMPKNLVYLGNQKLRSEKRRSNFEYEYNTTTDFIKNLIDEGYQRLKHELVSNKIEIVLARGDYLFIKLNDINTKLSPESILLPIRRLNNFTITSHPRKELEDQLSMFDIAEIELSIEEMDSEDILEQIIYTSPF